MVDAGLTFNRNQKLAISSEANLALSSCPGSGKTRTIVGKLLSSLDDVRHSPRKIGCITYTNAGVSEIERRLYKYSSYDEARYFEISTIHTFCLNNIFRPYHNHLEYFEEGFQIASPDTDIFLNEAKQLIIKHSLRNTRPADFEQIQREANGNILSPYNIDIAIANEFLSQLNSKSAITFGDIVYYSNILLEQEPFISKSLSSKFAWLLIDEFQDTSLSQIEILKKVYDSGATKFVLVGDVNQSIFGFAGAHPELLGGIAEYIEAQTDLALSGNYRCSDRIVGHAERLIPSNPPMESVGDSKYFEFEPILIHSHTTIDAVLNEFLPRVRESNISMGECAILAPNWFTLLHLGRKLREHGIPITGPGSRPYRRSREFAQFAEALCVFLSDKDSKSATYMARALFNMIVSIDGTPNWGIQQFRGKVALYTLVSAAKQLLAETTGLLDWITKFSEAAARILVDNDLLSLKNVESLTLAAENMKISIEQFVPEADQIQNDYLTQFEKQENCLTLSTMHSSKGLEFEAVLLVDLHDGKIPFFTAKSNSEISEARRLLYVAITRAKKILVYSTDASHERNVPSRFLGKDELGLI